MAAKYVVLSPLNSSIHRWILRSCCQTHKVWTNNGVQTTRPSIYPPEVETDVINAVRCKCYVTMNC